MFRGWRVFLICFLLFPPSALAREGESLNWLIDSPTAVLPARGSYSLGLRLQPRGGILSTISIGFLERLAVGFSYGGFDIIGYDKPDWNHKVEFKAGYRILDESYAGPAITLGFDSQGYGSYFDSLDRYEIKSKGFYGVASKAYFFFGTLSLHAGVNYSLEQKKSGDDDLNFFGGLEKSINPDLLLIAEYDAAQNDEKKEGGLGKGKGYLNLGVRFQFSEAFSLEADFRDLLENGGKGKTNRIVKIVYQESF